MVAQRISCIPCVYFSLLISHYYSSFDKITNIGTLLFLIHYLFILEEGREIHQFVISTYLSFHSLILVCALTRD